MTGLVIFLVAIACALLWIGIMAPAILRGFGVPVAFGSRRVDRLNQHLSKTQYVWACGVFSWGLGMFLFFTVLRYLEWKLLGDRFSFASYIIVGLPVWVAAGWLFGVFTAPHRRVQHRLSDK